MSGTNRVILFRAASFRNRCGNLPLTTPLDPAMSIFVGNPGPDAAEATVTTLGAKAFGGHPLELSEARPGPERGRGRRR